MSYSKDYRERTIGYRQSGHTLEEIHLIFKVSKSTIQKWEKQLKETEDSGKKELQRGLPKNRSGKVESLCVETSRRISIGHGHGVWMHRKRHS